MMLQRSCRVCKKELIKRDKERLRKGNWKTDWGWMLEKKRLQRYGRKLLSIFPLFLLQRKKSQFERRLICIRANPHNLAAAITVIYNVNIREKFCTPSLVPPSNHPLSKRNLEEKRSAFWGWLSHISGTESGTSNQWASRSTFDGFCWLLMPRNG